MTTTIITISKAKIIAPAMIKVCIVSGLNTRWTFGAIVSVVDTAKGVVEGIVEIGEEVAGIKPFPVLTIFSPTPRVSIINSNQFILQLQNKKIFHLST